MNDTAQLKHHIDEERCKFYEILIQLISEVEILYARNQVTPLKRLGYLKCFYWYFVKNIDLTYYHQSRLFKKLSSIEDLLYKLESKFITIDIISTSFEREEVTFFELSLRSVRVLLKNILHHRVNMDTKEYQTQVNAFVDSMIYFQSMCIKLAK